MAIKRRNQTTGKIEASEGGGRIKGARNLLQAEVLSDILRHWREGGKAAIDVVYKENPAAYLKTVAGILPKELLIEDARKIESMTDDELAHYLDEVRRLNARRLGQAGDDSGGRTNEALN